jgi:hypothetical protein
MFCFLSDVKMRYRTVITHHLTRVQTSQRTLAALLDPEISLIILLEYLYIDCQYSDLYSMNQMLY